MGRREEEVAQMERIPVNPGTVEWSGENPGIYLKESADGAFVSLISFFRVILSPHGRGHAAFLFLDPHGEGKSPGKPNVCATDNEPLARYLEENFSLASPCSVEFPRWPTFATRRGAIS